MDKFKLKESEVVSVIFEWFSDLDQKKTFSQFIDDLLLSYSKGNKLIIFGNGGSAAEASHIAAEFVGKCVRDIGRNPAIALTDSTSLLAIANDWSFEKLFSLQVEAHARPGDIALGLSTSGSINVLNGLETAYNLGCRTALWTSRKYNVHNSRNIHYTCIAPTESTPRAQELHLLWGHLLAEAREGIF